MCDFKFVIIVFTALFLGSPVLQAEAKTIRFKSVVEPVKWTATISGELIKPKGAGPFPAVVFMHSCGGLSRAGGASLRSHARYMQKHGFASLILDTFSSRGLAGGKLCKETPLKFTALRFGVYDVFNAMKYLQTLSYISKENIFLVGQSHGARLALTVSFKDESDSTLAFRGAAAFYPPCRMFGYFNPLKSPLLVLVGNKDTCYSPETPPSYCKLVEEEKLTSGADFKVVLYPNAHHGFDRNIKLRRSAKCPMGGNREAAADSRRQMRDFFYQAFDG